MVALLPFEALKDEKNAPPKVVYQLRPLSPKVSLLPSDSNSIYGPGVYGVRL